MAQQNDNKHPYNSSLRTARLHVRWSQRELADRLGTTTNNVSRWELGQTMPGPYLRARLCALFGKSAQELGLVDEHPPFPTHTAEAEQTTSSLQEEALTLWTVPYPRNPHFTGRDALLEQLEQHLSPPGQDDPAIARRVALTQPRAIKGLGGIGKTQIAVEYANRAHAHGSYTHTLWINAANEEAIMTSFVGLAELLPSFPAQEEKDQRKLVAAVKRWLEQCPQRWLLIFDNADDLSLVQQYFPQQGNGSLLLTTRAHAIGSLAVAIDVEQMSIMEGTQFLLSRAQRFPATNEESNEATNVVIALDGFPLALDQAGAYIEETGCSFGDYLQLYQAHRKAFLARRGKQTTSYPDSVVTTWSLSFQQIEQTNPAAAELLRLCAFLAPDHIPEELIQDGAAYWPLSLQQAAGDLLTFNQMLEDLLTFSLLKRLAEDHLLSIHRLVQAVQMDMMTPEEQRQWAERVVHAVDKVFPRDPKNEVATWPQCLRYLEQVQTCEALIQQYTLVLPEAADVLERTGTYLRENALYALAELLYQRALQIREQLGGLEHMQLISPLNNLAILYKTQGKFAEAETLQLRSIAICEHTLGSEHLQMGTALNGLANLYYEQGRFAEAESFWLRALHIKELHLGPEHPQVATTLNGLANTYLRQERYAEAEVFYQRSIEIWEGTENPKVAFSLNGLADLAMNQGRFAEAEHLWQRTLAIWTQQFGPDHPNVAYPLNNLAELYCKQECYTKAEPLFLQALAIWERQLGPVHPALADSFNGLAGIYQHQGRLQEAEAFFRRALAILEQTFGPQHVTTIDARERLSAVLISIDQMEAAAQLHGARSKKD